MRSRGRRLNTVSCALVLAALCLTSVARAEIGDDAEKIQPYIEKLKREHEIEGIIPTPPEEQSEAPIETEVVTPPKNQESDDPNVVQPYLEQQRLKNGLGPSTDKPQATESNLQPYIEELSEGRELKPAYSKTVDEAAGFSVVTSNKFHLSSDKAQANAFESVYNPSGKYSPSLDIFYERQILRSRYAGSLGPVFHANYIFTKGKGIFTNSNTPSNDTIFKFHALALSAGLSYRLSQLRIVQPYVQGSLVGIPFIETRDDGRASKRGISRGVSGILGVALNLDWIGRKNAWDQYDMHGILHTYVVAQVEYLRSISSTVKFDYDGLYAGLMFEF